MDVNKCTEGPEGLDFTLLEIVELVPMKSGFLEVKLLPEHPILNCTQDGCLEIADYITFMVCASEDHSYAFNCKECMKRIVQMAKDGVPAEVVH